MIVERHLEVEEEAPKSRRELRQERRRKKMRNLVGFLTPRRRRRASSAEERSLEKLYLKEEAPKSRRELRQKRQHKKVRGGLTEFIVTIVVAFVLVFGVVRPFAVEAYRIPSESMVPTLEVGDRVLANKFIYRFTEPQRGQIVVFDGVKGEEEDTLIKRVVGVARDKIQVKNGHLYVNNKAQDEPYLNQEGRIVDNFGPTRVPKGYVFLMGDNRGNSRDSRFIGPVPVKDLKGEAFLRFWPIPRIGPL